MRAFISYSSVDRAWGGAVKQALEGLGVDCFLAHEDIQVSEEWRTEIISELRRADIFVAILSSSFKASEWCGQEVGFAYSRDNVVFIPLRIDETAPYGFIAHLQGRRVAAPAQAAGIVFEALLRKKPRETIPLQIQRIRYVRGFRDAEALVAPLVPLFASFSDAEVTAFAEAAIANSQVWDAGLCRVEYLPAFLEVNWERMDRRLRVSLREKIEDPDLSPES